MVTGSNMSVWVENPNGGDADFELVAKGSGGNDVCSDNIHFYPFSSVVIALGGLNQVSTDPADANHGVLFAKPLRILNTKGDVVFLLYSNSFGSMAAVRQMWE